LHFGTSGLHLKVLVQEGAKTPLIKVSTLLPFVNLYGRKTIYIVNLHADC